MGVQEKIARGRIDWFRSRLLSWYQIHGRHFRWREKTQGSAYEIIVTEILLQRTRAEAVARLRDKFIDLYPTWQSLAQANPEELLKLITPLGLVDRRTAILLSLAKTVTEQGGIRSLDRASLEALPGVGQYIANAVLSICLNQREPMLDVNMARVLERFFGPRKMADIRYDPYLQRLSRSVLPENDSKTLNWAILDFGSLICTKRRPKCPECILATQCPSAHITTSSAKR